MYDVRALEETELIIAVFYKRATGKQPIQAGSPAGASRGNLAKV
jgi:hypothetical protein